MIIPIIITIVVLVIIGVLIHEKARKEKEFNDILIHLSTTVNVYRYIHSFNDLEPGRQIKEAYSQDNGLSFVLLSRHRLITQTYICGSLIDYLRFNRNLDKTAVQRLICFYNKHNVDCKTTCTLFYKHLYRCFYNMNTSNLASDFLQNHQNFVIGSGNHQTTPEPVSSDSTSTSYHWFRLIDLNLISPNHIDPSLYRFLSHDNNRDRNIERLLSRYPKPEKPAYVKPKRKIEKTSPKPKNIQSRSTCCICLDQPPDVMYLPCWHYVGCKACSEKIDSCPICRSHITEKKTVFTT